MPESSVLFLGMLYPEDIREEVVKKSHKLMETAMDAFQWNLISGLEANLSHPIDIINMLPVYSYPKHYTDWFIPTRVFSHTNGAEDVDVGYINIAYIKQLVKFMGLYSEVNAWVQKNRNSNPIMVVYSLEYGFLRCIQRIKRLWPDVHVCAVVADLPEYSNLSRNQSRIMRIYNRWKSRRARSLLRNVDSFALLTEQMRNALQLAEHQPHCVVEGIAKEFVPNEEQNTEEFTIVYTGTLHRCFGIETLVNAFRRIKEDGYRLLICGTGDYEKELLAQCREDSRISYLGILSHEETLRLQGKASVLVNPRQNNEEYTKYSFPSKTMEYLASGHPVVAYMLDGIPETYSQYLICPENASAEALAECLIRICHLPPEERAALGQRGRTFVLEQKNAICQTQKILDMIRSKTAVREKGEK